MFWFFGHKAYGISAPPPGIRSEAPSLEGDVLTTGPPGKALKPFFKWKHVTQMVKNLPATWETWA